MKKWVPFILTIVALGLVLGLSACKKSEGGAGADANTINVGEFASLTGKEAAFGQSSHKGTLLAIDEINSKGGVLGKKVNLIYEDNQSKSGESATIARKLISRDKVVAILGEVASGRSLEAAPICQQNQIPMISPSSTNPKVTQVGDYIFRVCFTDPFQGKLIANFAKNTLKVTKVAVLTDVAAPYSVGLATFFKEPFVANGGTIVADQKYNGGDKDFKAQLTAIKTANPEAIFVPGYYTEAALITQQARQLGINVPLFGGDGWEAQELVQIGGKAMEGTYYSTHYSSEDQSPLVQDFVNKYKAKNNGEIPDAMAALGYDSAMVLADAIKRAGTTDEPKLRDAIAATKDYVGLTGKTTLDAERNATKGAVIITIKDGKFKYVETVNP
ncbi:ABC transporter substrate-binding protein [Pedosphaera parvula]|uniref:Extracellular ligand-binding receptor n=1 Tax=Pedosphaera parvula (strain Ellin514) TaxID=320771 RepID=B9XLC1_PEDPL|nr:ABC transporter substrate-binding protein [Pedosphaera parvula]EEF59324.1 Extracellular ligand-binding receptor [Pedosphaera parvula Ellin514]